MRSLQRGVVLAVVGGLMGACSAAPVPQSGVLTGVTKPCVGAMPPGDYAPTSVQVTVTQGTRTVARQMARGPHSYRFVLPAGEYAVAAVQGGVELHAFAVPVHAGGIAHVDLGGSCK